MEKNQNKFLNHRQENVIDSKVAGFHNRYLLLLSQIQSFAFEDIISISDKTM